MKKILILLLTTFLFTTSSAQDLSEFFSNLLPGEGITEASIQINEDDNPDIEILAVRDIKSEVNSNFFTQFSLHTQEINNYDRYISNIGFGYRKLSEDKSNMYGINIFYDNSGSTCHIVATTSWGFYLPMIIWAF